jgi:hypothetical protein
MLKKKLSWFFPLLLLPFLASAFVPLAYAGDIHAVVEGSRTYMDFTRKTVNEYWLSGEKIYRKAETYLFITRKDLGVEWSVNLKDNTYYERKIEAEEPFAPEKEDIHTLGWEYNPQYDWDIRETGEAKDINGYSCQHVVARGDADFSEITLHLWLARDVPGTADYVQYMAEQLKLDMLRRAIGEILSKFKDRLPLEREEIIESPIAPTMRNVAKITKFETSDPPPNIYELPQGAKKMEEGRD